MAKLDHYYNKHAGKDLIGADTILNHFLYDQASKPFSLLPMPV